MRFGSVRVAWVLLAVVCWTPNAAWSDDSGTVFPTRSAATDAAAVTEVERADGTWAVRLVAEPMEACVARYTAALSSGVVTAVGQVVGIARDPARGEWNVSVVRDGYALYLIRLRDDGGRCEESLRLSGRGVHDADVRAALPPVVVRGGGEIDLDTL